MSHIYTVLTARFNHYHLPSLVGFEQFRKVTWSCTQVNDGIKFPFDILRDIEL